MCELMAMSSRLPTTISFSLLEFARHGGGTGPHEDGWGIAYAMGRDFRILKEAQAAADSDCVRYIQGNHFTSHVVLSHIRRATYPKTLSFENTHPFDRELAGRRFVFAHNGHLPGIEGLAGEAPRRFTPLGQTDSEQAFCLILNLLSERITAHGGYEPPLLATVLREVGPQLLALGRCNFLLSDGAWLFAHGDNSLHSVSRVCDQDAQSVASPQLQVRMAYSGTQHASVVATVPLTAGEDWRPFARGELRTFHEGREATL